MLLFNINMHKLKYIKILYIYMLLYLCKYSISPIIKKKNSSPHTKNLGSAPATTCRSRAGKKELQGHRLERAGPDEDGDHD
jgi:hypothetical protein